MRRRRRASLTVLSPARQRSTQLGPNTYSFDDSFVLVLTSPPRMQVQVVDETIKSRKPFIKKVVLTLAVLYKGISMWVRHLS